MLADLPILSNQIVGSEVGVYASHFDSVDVELFLFG
jgi:hypothetical protein